MIKVPVKKVVGSACVLLLLLLGTAWAENNKACPAGLVKGLTLDQEFGAGTQENTRCIERRHNLKLVVQINQLNHYGSTTLPYALGNLDNIIADYDITYGLERGRDYEIVAVVTGPAGVMMLNNRAATPNARTNPFQAQVETLISKGVQFHLCQNTARTMSIKNDQLIPGVKFVTAGVSALADFQLKGYTYLQP